MLWRYREDREFQLEMLRIQIRCQDYATYHIGLLAILISGLIYLSTTFLTTDSPLMQLSTLFSIFALVIVIFSISTYFNNKRIEEERKLDELKKKYIETL